MGVGVGVDVQWSMPFLPLEMHKSVTILTMRVCCKLSVTLWRLQSNPLPQGHHYGILPH